MEQFSGTVSGIDNYFIEGKKEAQVVKVIVENFSFLPGQYMMVSEDGFKLKADPSKVKWTTYSIASSPLDPFLEFVYTIKYTGGFTQYLSENLKVGGKLNFKGPLGNFVLEENGREKVFVATGAGIAPIISMIRTLLKKNSDKNIRLFYGFRTGSHFLYKKELESFQKFPNFQLLTTISREDPSWKGEQGYVQSLLEKNSFDPQKEEVYLCGNPEMVQQVRVFFVRKGFPKERVKIEQW